MQLKKLRLLSLSFLVSCSEGIDNGAEPQDEVQECEDPDHSPEVGVSQPVSLPFFVLHDESPLSGKLKMIFWKDVSTKLILIAIISAICMISI